MNFHARPSTPMVECRWPLHCMVSFLDSTLFSHLPSHPLSSHILSSHPTLLGSTVTPATMFAHPINRQCLSILRLSAIFSPTSVQAGLVRTILAASPLTPTILAPVAVLPMFTMITSAFESLLTLACLPSAVLTPSRRRSRK